MDIRPLLLSLETALSATVICFFTGMLSAWIMVRYKGPFKNIIDGVLTLPMVLPPTVTGFFLLVLIGKRGPVGKFFHMMGIDLIFTIWAAIAASAIVSFPLMYRSLRAAFEQVDESLLHASRTLGAGEFRTFIHICIPLSLPGIAAGTVLSFARALGEFGATLMVAGNIPGRTQTIPLAIFFSAEGGDMGKAGIWVLLITVISFIVVFSVNYLANRKR
ncbi:MAG: molybdate ABC transporter permease subunit [Spirochaetes bacterium]|nr:molybdate ABC transporter permease subunit [Spirochaetota bacterium]